MRKIEDWIKVYDDAIPSDFCDECMSLFTDDTIQKGQFKETWRRCIEISGIDTTRIWDKLKQIITDNFVRYRNETSTNILYNANMIEAPSAYRYDVNSEAPNYFHLHSDNWNYPTSTRQLSIILYLNDVEEGGATNFCDLDISVKPKKGRILLFPPFYNYMHTGESPISNSKYIIVTWIHFEGKNHAYRVNPM